MVEQNTDWRAKSFFTKKHGSYDKESVALEEFDDNLFIVLG